MTPEQQQQFDQMLKAVETLTGQVMELLQYKADREEIQITDPLDDISRQNLRAVSSNGNGTAAVTTPLVVGAGGGSFTIAKAPTRTVLLQTADGIIEVGDYSP